MQPRTPLKYAISVSRMTSVYQRSKSTESLVSCFGNPCSSGFSDMKSDYPGLRRGGCRGPDLGGDQVDLGQENGQQLRLGDGLVELPLPEDDALAAPTG